MNRNLTIFTFCVLSLCSGCGAVDKVDEAIKAVDRLITLLESAKTDLNSQSDAWRRTVNDAAGKAEDAGSNLIARDLKSVGSYSANKFGIEIRCNWTFARSEVEAALQKIIGTLRKQKVELQKNGVTDELVDEILNAIGERPKLAPFICDCNRNEVLLLRGSDGRLRLRHNEEVLEYTGFGFEEEDGKFNEKWDAHLLVRGNGPDRRLPDGHRAINQAPFSLTVNTSVIVPFLSEADKDTKLVLKVGRQEFERPILIRGDASGVLTKPHVMGKDRLITVTPNHAPKGLTIELYGDSVKLLTPREFETLTKRVYPLHNYTVRRISGHVYTQLNDFRKHKESFVRDLSKPPFRFREFSTRHLRIPDGGSDGNLGNKGHLVSVNVGLKTSGNRVRLTTGAYVAEWNGQMPHPDFTAGTGRQETFLQLDPELAEEWEIVDILSDFQTNFTVLARKRDESFIRGESVVSELSTRGYRLDEIDGSNHRFRCDVKLSGIRVLLARKGQFRVGGRAKSGELIVLPKD